MLLRLECFVAHGKAELKVAAELDPLERGQNLGIFGPFCICILVLRLVILVTFTTV